MSSDEKIKKEFTTILEEGAAVDDLFKAPTIPKGTNPFLAVQLSESVLPPPAMSVGGEPLEISDENDSQTAETKLEAIGKLLKLFNLDLSFSELTAGILKVCIESVRSEAASLFEVDYVQEQLFFRAVAGKSSENLLKIKIPKGSGIVGRVCEEKRSEVLSHNNASTAHLKSISDLIGFQVRDVVACPIIIKGFSFGCIELLNPAGYEKYTTADVSILESICAVASKIIETRLMFAATLKELNMYKVKNAA